MRSSLLSASLLVLFAVANASHDGPHRHAKKYVWGTSVLQDGDDGPAAGSNANLLHSSTEYLTTPAAPTAPSFPPLSPAPSASSSTTTTPPVFYPAPMPTPSSSTDTFTSSSPHIVVASDTAAASSLSSSSSSPSPTQTTPAVIHWYLAPMPSPQPTLSATSSVIASPASVAAESTHSMRLTFGQRKAAAAAAAAAKASEAALRGKKRWIQGSEILQDPTASPVDSSPSPSITAQEGRSTPNAATLVRPTFPGMPGPASAPAPTSTSTGEEKVFTMSAAGGLGEGEGGGHGPVVGVTTSLTSEAATVTATVTATATATSEVAAAAAAETTSVEPDTPSPSSSPSSSSTDTSSSTTSADPTDALAALTDPLISAINQLAASLAFAREREREKRSAVATEEKVVRRRSVDLPGGEGGGRMRRERRGRRM